MEMAPGFFEQANNLTFRIKPIAVLADLHRVITLHFKNG